MTDLPIWALAFPHDVIEVCAGKYGIHKEYVYSIVQQESRGRTYATRFEHELYLRHLERARHGRLSYFLRPENFAKLCFISVDTERAHQMTSWGLMQVMGFKAREMGFAEPLPMACLPHVGLELGCRAFAGFLKRYDGNYKHAVLAFNAGSVRMDPREPRKFVNQHYLDGVLSWLNDMGHT